MESVLIFVLVVSVIIAVVGIVIHNSIITAGNGAERAWANVINYERLKLTVLPLIERASDDYKGFEAKVMTDVTALRTAIDKLDSGVIDTQKLAQVEQLSGHLQSGIRATMEAYPDLKASTLVQQLMREISEKHENVAASIAVFNENVEQFNNRISMFPNSVVNSWFTHKKVLNTFSDSAASSSFQYSPNFS